MSSTDFRDYRVTAPQYDDVAAEYRPLTDRLEAAQSADEAIAVVEAWDALRRRLYSWTALVGIRFNQDTRNEQYKKDRDYCDELEPRLTNLAVDMKRRVMASPHRAALAERFGGHAFELWECDVASFDPAIEGDLTEQSKLSAQYTALLASGKFDFQGESLTLSQLVKFAQHPDRAVRHDAARLQWNWFGENREHFDAIFDGLVRLRHRMAEKLGRQSFIEVGYQRMQRVGYGQGEVERFRAQVREHVVPFTVEIRRRQAARLGTDPLMAWDEALHEPAGNPKPQGDHDWMIDRASEMFAQMGSGLDEFFTAMRARHLMDLRSREGKGAGGFCEILPEFGMPFIYANFNGTERDVLVFTHEMGHAFQSYSSLHTPLCDYIFPTAESCEIHSMSLEFLTWPQMDLFFGADADRFRQLHLTTSLLIFPYCVAVDHFQHLVYDQPHASPDERAAMWQEMERMYLPALNWGDLSHAAGGRRWQAQLHIYKYPFYYIDYALALACALQLWVRAAEDRTAALNSYVDLCRRGGEAPFGELVRSAGLASPFDDDCLKSVVEHAYRQLSVPAL